MRLINILTIATLINVLGLTTGCKKNSELTNPPVVTTNAATNISSTSAISGGVITNATNITDKGIIWGVDNSTLSVSNVNKISNGLGQLNFTDTIKNLQPNTTYYLRAYAENNSGVGYGTTMKFTTLPSQPTVYTAGCIGIAAVYWKNDTPIYLTDGTDIAWARSIYVVGNDVYAAGEELPWGGTFIAVYWKNGQKVSLTDGTNGAVAESIYVVGNDVYVAGYELLNNISTWPIPKYWKNGVSVPLSIKNRGIANSIYVVGNDVYAAGFTTSINAGFTIATYWKNGLAVSLIDSTKANGTAESIFVMNNDVYVAGNERQGLGYNGVPVAKYWKNGTAISLTDGSQFAGANSIYVIGVDVYIAGYEYDRSTGFSTAKYWKNGSPFPLTDGSKFADGNSIFVVGNNVYVAIDEAFSSMSPNFQPKYWESGTLVSLYPPTTDSRATSIFVQ